MFYLLDIRNTILKQERELLLKKLEDLKRAKKALFDSVLNYIDDEDKRKKEDLIRAMRNNDESKPTTRIFNKLRADIMKTEIMYWEIENRYYMYNGAAEISLKQKDTEREKNILWSLINIFQSKMKNGEISKNAVEFLNSEGHYKVVDDLSREFTNIGCNAFIDECHRVLNVINKIESNKLVADSEDHEITIASCVENLQKTGIHMTKTEFIETVHSNVWATDKENGYNTLVNLDLDQAKESTN